MSLGIYIHVPFCRRICPYCAFNVVRQTPTMPSEALREAIQAEATAHAPLFQGPLKTVYFGGGTPSLMSAAWIQAVLEHVTSLFASDKELEVTLEVEPDTMDEQALSAVRHIGVNRLSIGWQSSVPRVLKALGRAQSVDSVDRLLVAARRAGFDNINLDWMVAAPGQTDEEFSRDAEAMAALKPAHVSVYVLTIEPKTPFARRAAQGTLSLPGEEAEVRWLTRASDALKRAGLSRYEVASFARPGKQSRHNRAYWTGRPYLGLGPGAHSFWREGWQSGRRWMGHKSWRRYLVHWQQHLAPLSPALSGTDFVETLAPSDLAFEQVMVGLRRVAGIALDAPSLKPFAQAVSALCEALCARGWATVSDNRLRPTAQGLLHADAAALLFDIDASTQTVVQKETV